MELDCSANIKAARSSAHMTQKQLADAIGKTVSTVQKYELGLAMPPLDVLGEIAKKTNTSVGFLIYGPKFMLFGDGTTTPDAARIGRAYEKATPPVQRTVEVALEPFMEKEAPDKGDDLT